MKYSPYLMALSLLALSACASNTVKDTLGLSRAAPDEFRVVSRPPLSVPPQFSLRAPGPGEMGAGQAQSADQAKSLMIGAGDTKPLPVLKGAATTPQAPKVSSAENTFLKNAGAEQADPNVRTNLVEERIVKEQTQEDASWWNIMATNPEKKEPLVKADAEAERIKKNKEAGKPVTEGETPETKARDTGVLGRIFGY